jgi:hypothetical protein
MIHDRGPHDMGYFGWLQDVRSLVYAATPSQIRLIKTKVSEIPASIRKSSISTVRVPIASLWILRILRPVYADRIDLSMNKTKF